MRRLLVGLLVLVLVSPATVWGWVREHGNVEKVVLVDPGKGFVVVVSNSSSVTAVGERAEALARRVCHGNVSFTDGDVFSVGGLSGAWGSFKCVDVVDVNRLGQEWAARYYSGPWLEEGGWYKPFNVTAYENMVYRLFFGVNYTNSSSCSVGNLTNSSSR